MCFHMLMNMSKFTFSFPKIPFTTGVCMFSFSGFFFFFKYVYKEKEKLMITTVTFTQADRDPERLPLCSSPG